MSTSIGHTFLYNLIILFIIIIFAFLSGTLSYYKAFKVNNRIVYIIEKYEGYNEFAKTEIDTLLSNLGYSVESPNCKTDYKKMYLVDNFEYNYKYCVYIEEEKGYVLFDIPAGGTCDSHTNELIKAIKSNNQIVITVKKVFEATTLETETYNYTFNYLFHFSHLLLLNLFIIY